MLPGYPLQLKVVNREWDGEDAMSREESGINRTTRMEK